MDETRLTREQLDALWERKEYKQEEVSGDAGLLGAVFNPNLNRADFGKLMADIIEKYGDNKDRP